jgi:hypothetical protein
MIGGHWRKLMRHLCLAFLAVIAGSIVLAAPPAQGLLTIDALIDIKHPSQAAWSPDQLLTIKEN